MSSDDHQVVKYTRPAESEFKPALRHRVRQKHGISINTCEHLEVEVDREARTVTCGKCGVAMDPIQCLINIAYHERLLDERIEIIRKYESECRRKAAAKEAESSASAARRIATLQTGDWISVTARDGSATGRFAGVHDGELHLTHPECLDGESLFHRPVEAILTMRRTKMPSYLRDAK